MVLRDPNGSDGNVAAMRDAGFGIVCCNVRDFAPEAWWLVRQRAEAAGVVCCPWGRTATAGTWDEGMLQRLARIADDWRSPLLVNSEKELDGSGSTLTRHIAEVCGDRDWALSMEAWPYASVDWSPLAGVPVCPQIFPAESPPAEHPDDCRHQWQLRGVRCVVFTFGSYAGMRPEQFDRLSPYGVYTGDDCGGNYEAWRPLGICDPCVHPPSPEEDFVEPISDQQALDSHKTASQAAISAYADPKPKGRNTIIWRIANANDASWNACRDAVLKALNDAHVPDVPT